MTNSFNFIVLSKHQCGEVIDRGSFISTNRVTYEFKLLNKLFFCSITEEVNLDEDGNKHEGSRTTRVCGSGDSIIGAHIDATELAKNARIDTYLCSMAAPIALEMAIEEYNKRREDLTIENKIHGSLES